MVCIDLHNKNFDCLASHLTLIYDRLCGLSNQLCLCMVWDVGEFSVVKGPQWILMLLTSGHYLWFGPGLNKILSWGVQSHLYWYFCFFPQLSTDIPNMRESIDLLARLMKSDTRRAEQLNSCAFAWKPHLVFPKIHSTRQSRPCSTVEWWRRNHRRAGWDIIAFWDLKPSEASAVFFQFKTEGHTDLVQLSGWISRRSGTLLGGELVCSAIWKKDSVSIGCGRLRVRFSVLTLQSVHFMGEHLLRFLARSHKHVCFLPRTFENGLDHLKFQDLLISPPWESRNQATECTFFKEPFSAKMGFQNYGWWIMWTYSWYHHTHLSQAWWLLYTLKKKKQHLTDFYKTNGRRIERRGPTMTSSNRLVAASALIIAICWTSGVPWAVMAWAQLGGSA